MSAHRPWFSVLAIALAMTVFAAGAEGALIQRLLVVNSSGGTIRKYGLDGSNQGVFATVTGANGITLGPDGDVYVTQVGGVNGIQRFDINGNAKPFGSISTSGAGVGVVTAAFAPDGYLYYTTLNGTSSKVLRVEGPSMANPGTPDPTFSITANNLLRGITILDGTTSSNYSILYGAGKVYYHTGSAAGSFTYTGDPNYTTPGDNTLLVGLHIRPDGTLFVGGGGNNVVYSGAASAPGTALTAFTVPQVGTNGDFLVDNVVDETGNLYVSDLTNNTVYRYNPTGGAKTTFETSANGLNSPVWMTIMNLPEPTSLAVFVAGGSLVLARRRRHE